MARASFSHWVVSTCELPAPFGGEPVELGAAVVLGGALFGGDPAALDQPVQRRIERPLLDLQHVVRIALDGLGDGVAVRRPEQQRAQDQQVERALQQFDAVASSLVDILGEAYARSGRMSRGGRCQIVKKAFAVGK